jgi:hypothetical protein
MSDTGLTVSGMTEPPRRYDVTITVEQDGGHQPNPAEFAVAAQQAASARAASIISADTARQIVSVVTVLTVDQPRGGSPRPGRRVRRAKASGRGRPPADGSVVADLVRLPSQIWVLLGLAACDQDFCS